MDSMTYVGLDLHKRSVAYCVKTPSGRIVDEGTVLSSRAALREWAQSLRKPWEGGMEATLFTGWVYDLLLPYAAHLRVGHPLMLKAICCSKKKSDKIDARKLADLVRSNLFPDCTMLPKELRQLRRVLRFRNRIVRQAIRMKNTVCGLLMESGQSYSKRKLHGKRYFAELLDSLEDVPESVIELLNLSHGTLEFFTSMQKKLIAGLRGQPLLCERVDRLMTIPGVGEITALTWALEVGDPDRFGSVREAVSYCGLCSAYSESGGKERRGPISKQRNKYLQTILIEASKIAPQWNAELRALRDRERMRGHHNRATLVVGRKLVAYLMAVDKRGTAFEDRASRAGGEGLAA